MRRRFLVLLALFGLLLSCKPSDPNEAVPPGDGAETGSGKETGLDEPQDTEKAPVVPPSEDQATVPEQTPADNSTQGEPAGIPLDPFVPQGKVGDPAARVGLKQTPSRLQYVVLQEGEGETPEPGASVKVHITGWIRTRDILSRKIIDSRENKIPKEYELTETDLISGLVEALSGMRRGERRWIIVPARLGYGMLGYGRTVPPNQDLVFDVQLVDFE